MVLENILVIKVIVEIVVNSDKRKIDNLILTIDTRPWSCLYVVLKNILVIKVILEVVVILGVENNKNFEYCVNNMV